MAYSRALFILMWLNEDEFNRGKFAPVYSFLGTLFRILAKYRGIMVRGSLSQRVNRLD